MDLFTHERFHKLRDITFKGVLAERVRHFDLMLQCSLEIVEILKQREDSTEINGDGYLHRDLTKIEKNLINRSIKGLLSIKREAWRTLQEEHRHQHTRLVKYTNTN
jgi:hypothetical protein